jgi:hypothetical protein
MGYVEQLVDSVLGEIFIDVLNLFVLFGSDLVVMFLKCPG